MQLFHENELKFAEAIAALNYTNPFAPERIELEKTILGKDYREKGLAWSSASNPDICDPNVQNIMRKVEDFVFKLYKRLGDNAKTAGKELEVYENIVIYYLFEKYREALSGLIFKVSQVQVGRIYDSFEQDFQMFFSVSGHNFSERHAPLKTFEIYFQIHRAFYYIFDFIIGGSPASAQLRSSIWQSIFTHDIYRYNRTLYNKMQNITTLITGPSGTGKELVARAVSLSQYIPFDPGRKCFAVPFSELFLPLHLSAMPQTLIESEVFGHCKGAFTGAVQDRAGRMETCSEYGTVFLDEIGEINEEIQVKLLRLLQNRSFQRIGEHKERLFKGKILAATNRDLQQEICNGKFRVDLYYRLCSDIIVTPSLRDILAGSEAELMNFVVFISQKIVGVKEADYLADESVQWIKRRLGLDYDWPGNVRELEQCIRNVLIRGGYTPPTRPCQENPFEQFFRRAEQSGMTADELLNRYCEYVYRNNQNYIETAELLQLDRRTVKKRVTEAADADNQF